MRTLPVLTLVIASWLALATADEPPTAKVSGSPHETGGTTEPMPAGISTEDQRAIASDLPRLREELAELKSPNLDLRADVDIFNKGITWALRYETNLTPNDLALVKKALVRGLQR